MDLHLVYFYSGKYKESGFYTTLCKLSGISTQDPINLYCYANPSYPYTSTCNIQFKVNVSKYKSISIEFTVSKNLDNSSSHYRSGFAINTTYVAGTHNQATTAVTAANTLAYKYTNTINDILQFDCSNYDDLYIFISMAPKSGSNIQVKDSAAHILIE